MILKTRRGVSVTLDIKSVLKQERFQAGKETYYVVHLSSARKVELATPVPGVDVIESIKVTRAVVSSASVAPEYTERRLPRAEDCPSAGNSMVAGKNVDYHAHEKVKGETFFTHKTAPGLNIVSPSGKLIYETKMADMYRRRD